MHKLKVLKLEDFITPQNILFVCDCLEKGRMKSFNTTFKRMETDQFHNTRSFNTHQLKRRNFKTEKYGHSSILSKCLSAWNLLQNVFKTNFKKIRKKEKIQKSKHLWQTTSLINTQSNSTKNKQLQINSAHYTFTLYLSTASYPSQCLSLSFSVFLLLSLFSFLFLLPFLLSSPTQRTRSNLKLYLN